MVMVHVPLTVVAVVTATIVFAAAAMIERLRMEIAARTASR